jgi:outer membrane transport energization protein TonB (TC 2.C.1.1.1)
LKQQKNKVEGKVYIRFIVTENGDIDKATVMRSLNKDCDEEALRVIKGMPKWEPGKQNGVNASVYYVIPIHFSLNKNKTITNEKALVKMVHMKNLILILPYKKNLVFPEENML